MYNLNQQLTAGFDCVNFTFTNLHGVEDVTTNVFDTQQYLYDEPQFKITGTMGYNQWNQDSLMCPKLIKSIKILTYSIIAGAVTPSPNPLQNINMYYQNLQGTVYSYWKEVNTTINQYQSLPYIVMVDFDYKKKEFTLSGDTYISNYTFPRMTITSFNIEFQEIPNVEGILFGNNKGVVWNNKIDLNS